MDVEYGVLAGAESQPLLDEFLEAWSLCADVVQTRRQKWNGKLARCFGGGIRLRARARLGDHNLRFGNRCPLRIRDAAAECSPKFLSGKQRRRSQQRK